MLCYHDLLIFFKYCFRFNSILSDPESPYVDSYSALSSGNECELEVTHFGADCVTKVVRDNCGQSQVNFLTENKSMTNSRDAKQSQQPTELKTNKIQQLRSEFQRHHRERQGQYPMDDVEDQYEKRLRAQERNNVSQNSNLINSVFEADGFCELSVA